MKKKRMNKELTKEWRLCVRNGIYIYIYIKMYKHTCIIDVP